MIYYVLCFYVKQYIMFFVYVILYRVISTEESTTTTICKQLIFKNQQYLQAYIKLLYTKARKNLYHYCCHVTVSLLVSSSLLYSLVYHQYLVHINQCYWLQEAQEVSYAHASPHIAQPSAHYIAHAHSIKLHVLGRCSIQQVQCNDVDHAQIVIQPSAGQKFRFL